MRNLKSIKIIGCMSLLMVSGSVLASPYGDADVLFGCIIKGKANKEAVVLRNGDDITYMFGKSDPEGEGDMKPDISVTKKAGELNKSWNYSSAEGVSLYSLKIPNGKYSYEVSYSDTGKEKEGNITVFKNDEYVTSIKCTDLWEQHLNDDGLMKGIPDENGNVDDSQDNVTSDSQSNSQNNSQVEESLQNPPVKVQMKDIPYELKANTTAQYTVKRHVYVYSIQDSVTITGISIDRGSCYNSNFKPSKLSYGKKLDFGFFIKDKRAYANSGWNWIDLKTKYSDCMWSEVEVKTDKGNYTFNFD